VTIEREELDRVLIQLLYTYTQPVFTTIYNVLCISSAHLIIKIKRKEKEKKYKY